MRKIAVIITFGNEKREAEMHHAAKAHGFEMDFIDYRKLHAEDLADYEVIFGMVKPDMLKSAKALRWFHCSFAGVDKFCDQSLFSAQDVVMTNSAGAFGITISEHMIVTLLMLMRKMPEYHELQKTKSFQSAGSIKSIYGSIITVVGMGDIGTNFAKRTHGMGAYVRGVRRTEKQADAYYDEVYTFENIDKAIENADVVALCVPETQSTISILSRERLAKLKNDAIVLNVGRGSAIDEEAIADALNNGSIGGAALDVFANEPLYANSPLWTAKNCIVTPHVSGNINLSLTCDLLIKLFIDNLHKYADGKPLNNVVDISAGY